MKINTSLSDNFLYYFDEARGFAIHKKRILKRKDLKCLSFIQSKAIIFIGLLVFSLIFALIENYFMFSVSLFVLSILYLIIVIIRVSSSYNYRKKRVPNNTIIIDENGITDESFYDIKITIKWSKVKAIILGKYTVTILTDTPIYFYFDISKKYEIINEASKYISNDIIIK